MLVEEPDHGHIVPDAMGGTKLLGKMSDVTGDGEDGWVDEGKMVMVTETDV